MFKETIFKFVLVVYLPVKPSVASIINEGRDDIISTLVSTNCIVDILSSANVDCGSKLTIANFGMNEDPLLKQIVGSTCYSFEVRRFFCKSCLANRGYIIYADDLDTLSRGLRELSLNTFWRPQTKSIIILKNANHIRDTFEVLLKFMMHNVVVVSQNEAGSFAYTYFPYDNNACGRHFNKAVILAKCGETQRVNFFPEKHPTGLTNCTLKIITRKLPPVVYDPTEENRPRGTDEVYVSLLAKIEGFNYEFRMYDGIDGKDQLFGDVDKNFSATSMLAALQNGEADCLVCHMALTDSRIRLFDFVYPYNNEVLKLLVPVARPLPRLNVHNSYLFAMASISFICYGLLSMKIKPFSTMKSGQDDDLVKSWICLFGYALGNPAKIRTKRTPTRLFVMSWILFIFLLSTSYQTALVGILNTPSLGHQVTTYKEIVERKMKFCVSDPYLPHIFSIEYLRMLAAKRPPSCQAMQNAIKTVAENIDMFTVLTKTYFKYQVELYTYKGKPQIVPIKDPLYFYNTVMYCNKGIPYLAKMDRDSVWIRSSGILDKTISDISYNQTLDLEIGKNITNREDHFTKLTMNDIFGVFLGLGVGYALSIIAFVLELSYNRLRL